MNDFVKKQGKYFNKKMNEIFLKGRNYYHTYEEDRALPYYIEVFKYLINFAKRKGIRTLDNLDRCGIIEDYLMNFIDDYEIIALNSNEDLLTLLSLEREFINTFELTDIEYRSALRLKTTLLFKLGRVEEGERGIVKELKKDSRWLWGYVELVDDFSDYCKDKDKAKYYFDLGLRNCKNDSDIDALKERADRVEQYPGIL